MAICMSFQSVFADSKDKDLVELMKVMQIKEQLSKSFDNAINMQSQAFGGNPEVIKEIRKFYEKNFGWDVLKADIMKIYKGVFSQEEIKALTAFYKTPAGQKLVDAQPAIQQEMMKVTMQRMQKAMPKLQAIIMNAVKKNPPAKAKIPCGDGACK